MFIIGLVLSLLFVVGCFGLWLWTNDFRYLEDMALFSVCAMLASFAILLN